MATWLIPQLTTAQIDAATPSTPGDIAYNQDTGEVVIAVPNNLASPVTGENSYQVIGPAGETADSSITLAKLSNGTGNEVLVTNSSTGVTERLAVAQNELVGRSSGGIVSQSLQDAMISNDTISHAKLIDIKPGQVLGALANNDVSNADVSVGAVNISDIRGASITSSDAAPTGPITNDLWFYPGAENGDSARLYIYQNNIWVDASPAIVNTMVGADGATGPAGADGTGVASVAVGARNAGDDIVLNFYSSAMQNADTFISAATIPIADIAVAGVPAAPARRATDTDYRLRVPAASSSAVSWEQIPAVTSISFARDDGLYTVVSGDTGASGTLILNMASFGFASGTQLSAAHTLSYIGFVLSTDGDYTYDLAADTITISSAVKGIIQAGETFNLINFRATVS